jgi:glycosyltransferase involved in cell wall biosynthesis
MNVKKIIFISHDATRTGAPILLLRLITALKKLNQFDIAVVLVRGGELETTFKEVAETHVLNAGNAGATKYFRKKLMEKLGMRKLTKEAKHRAAIFDKIQQADYVVANTVLSIKLVQQLVSSNQKIFFYIHELSYATSQLVTRDEMYLINRVATRVLVPANYVKLFLQSAYQFDENKISILKYIVPDFQFTIPSNNNSNANEFRIGTCGTVNLRKGYDIFLHVARELIYRRSTRDVKFYWIGINGESSDLLIFKNDIKKCGLEKYIVLIESNSEVVNHLNALDILLLTSREDAYPLVVLEAASLGVPTVYFNDSGGIDEFIDATCGIKVDYLDIESMTEAIVQLKNDPALLKEYAVNARAKFLKEPTETEIVKNFVTYLD